MLRIEQFNNIIFMFIDTHSHVNFDAFCADADQVIKRALDDDVWVILVGTDRKTSKKAISLANKYQEGVYAAVGLHPVHLDSGTIIGEDYKFNPRFEEFSNNVYEELAKFEKTVAIGEIGLDYYHLPDGDIEIAKKKQKEVFLAQLQIARAQDLPVIIHCREAHIDMINVIESFRRENRAMFPRSKPWGAVHCFGESEDIAWKYFNLGLLISFTGNITFGNNMDGLIRRIPSNKFMIETDAPYLTPEPFRGKRNEPVLVKGVADKIAKVKNLSLDRVAEFTTQNARTLFGI